MFRFLYILFFLLFLTSCYADDELLSEIDSLQSEEDSTSTVDSILDMIDGQYFNNEQFKEFQNSIDSILPIINDIDVGQLNGIIDVVLKEFIERVSNNNIFVISLIEFLFFSPSDRDRYKTILESEEIKTFIIDILEKSKYGNILNIINTCGCQLNNCNIDNKQEIIDHYKSLVCNQTSND